MKMLKNLGDKLLKSLLFGRFEPIETTISASSFVHGVIIFGSHALAGRSILGVDDSLEVFAGAFLIFAGVSVIRSVCREYNQVRKFSMFGQFLAWTLLTSLIFAAPGLPLLVHLGYATLSIIAAFLYLNLSLGVRDD